MAQQTAEGTEISIKINNVGGISHSAVELEPGVNILSGPNATNRTSFLKALAAAQGSKNVPLKGDKSEAEVELALNGSHYKRTIREQDGALVFEGSSPLSEDQAEIADLFAFLFERNRARSAIRQGDDLRNVVMEPVDTDEIQREIDALKNERSDTEEQLKSVQSLQNKLPKLKQQKSELSSEISELEETLSEKRSELDADTSDVSENKEQKQAIEEKVSQLRQAESELDSVQSKIDRANQAISHLEDDLNQAETELADLSSIDTDELYSVKSELDTLHDRVSRKERMMSELQNVIQFNKDIIEDESTDSSAFSILSPDEGTQTGDESVTEQLMSDNDEITCWTCGSSTTPSQIAETVEQLQGVHEDLYGERETLREQIEEYTSRKEELERAQEEKADLEDAVADINDQLSRRRENLERLQEEEAELEKEIEELNTEIENLRKEREDEVLSLHQEINNLEIDLQEARDKKEYIAEEIDEIKSRGEQIEPLQSEIEQLTAQIEELNQRVDSLERQAVEEFNQHMDSVLEILEYENIERVWIERREVDVKEGRRRVTRTQFDLHIVREAEDGTSYEDTVDHLSESEREVTGLVFALAGYLAHEVYEFTPFMILDSLESIDSDRIASLLDYLSEYADNLAVALLPEDAQALSDDYNRVASIA